jgi:hypothetical protein
MPTGRFHKNLVGKTFGKLTVVEYVGTYTYGSKRSTKKAMWKSKCVCGKYTTVATAALNNGHTTSCGSCSMLKPEGEAAFNEVYRQYKYQAKVRSLEFCITKEHFKTLTKGNCYYCGVEPRQLGNSAKRCSPYIYNGVDRKDNKQGYTVENSVPCCKVCNKAKLAMSLSQFMEWINRLISYNTVKEMPRASEQEQHDGILSDYTI